MPKIRIQIQTIKDWHDRRTSASLPPHVRVYASTSFFTSDTPSVLIPAGDPEGGDIYLDIVCIQSGTVVTIPAFDLDSTTDSPALTQNSSYNFYFYTASGARISKSPFLTSIIVPPEISSTSGCSPFGTCCTMTELVAWNRAPFALTQPTDSYSKLELDARLAALANLISTVNNPVLTGLPLAQLPIQAGRLQRATDGLRGLYMGNGIEAVSVTGRANVKDFGARGDVRVSELGNMSAGSPILTCSDGAFSATDEGKIIDVNSSGAQTDLYAVIVSITNTTTVVLSTAASFTLVGATLTIRGATFTCNTTAGSKTITSAGAGFSSVFDLNRPIVVANAGRWNKVGTILSVTNPTTVTLSFSATGNVVDKSVVFGTDDTSAFRAAVDAAQVVYCPASNDGYLVSTFSVGASGFSLGFKGAILVHEDGKVFEGDADAPTNIYAIGPVGSDASSLNAAIALITPPTAVSTVPMRSTWRYLNFLGTNTHAQQSITGNGGADGVIVDGGSLPNKPVFVSRFEYCTFSRHWLIGYHHFGPGRTELSYCEAHYNCADGFNPTNLDGASLDHCRATYNGGGFESAGGENLLTNSYIAYNRNGGIGFGGFGDPDLGQDCHMALCIVEFNGGTGVVVGSNLQYINLSDNIIRQNDLGGVAIHNQFGSLGKFGQVRNNQIYSNGTAAFGTGTGLSLTETSFWDIEGNIIKDLGLAGYFQGTGIAIVDCTDLSAIT